MNVAIEQFDLTQDDSPAWDDEYADMNLLKGGKGKDGPAKGGPRKGKGGGKQSKGSPRSGGQGKQPDGPGAKGKGKGKQPMNTCQS